MNNNIELTLKEQLINSTPNVFNKVKNAPVMEDSLPFTEKAKIKTMMKVCISCVSVFVLAIAATFIFYYTPQSKIYLDINPSIEVVNNAFDKVIGVNPVNDDAKAILENTNFTFDSTENAITKIMTSLYEKGYIKQDGSQNVVLISIDNNNDQVAVTLNDKLAELIKTEYLKYNAEGIVIKQKTKPDKETEKLANENNVSVGKMQFITKLCEMNKDLKPEDLAKLSMIDIANMIAKNDIKIDDATADFAEDVLGVDDDLFEADDDEDDDTDDTDDSDDADDDDEDADDNDDSDDKDDDDGDDSNDTDDNDTDNDDDDDDDKDDDKDEDDDDDDDDNSTAQGNVSQVPNPNVSTHNSGSEIDDNDDDNDNSINETSQVTSSPSDQSSDDDDNETTTHNDEQEDDDDEE